MNDKLDSSNGFHYNPFGGLSDEELFEVLVPNPNVDNIVNDINGPKQLVIELVGKKGRGKTSHLKYIRKLCGTADLFELSAKKKHIKELFAKSRDLVFVDSIHHLSFLDRLKLYKLNSKLVVTTHTSRVVEYALAGVSYSSYKFKGISKDQILTIVRRRMELAQKNRAKLKIDEIEIDSLLRQHNDDFRAILKSLYMKFGQ